MNKYPKTDLCVGHKFNRLLVLSVRRKARKWGKQEPYFMCECDCGNIKEIRAISVKSGQSKSCGCLQKEARHSREDLSGMNFGFWTAISFSHSDMYSRSIWNCKCVCGNYKKISHPALKLGKSKSCGCMTGIIIRDSGLKDLTGKRFGKLLVLKYSHNSNGKVFYLVLCDCGLRKFIRGDSLSGNKTKSCGCLQREFASSQTGDKNNFWRGGSPIKYPPEWTERLRESIRNRDNRVCQYPNCTYDDTKKRRKLHVHHIDSNKFNCNSYNLISLCNSHHIKIEKVSPQEWQYYFNQIVGDYV